MRLPSGSGEAAWELPGNCLEAAWRLPEGCLEAAWKLPRSCLEAAWDLPRRCLEAAVLVVQWLGSPLPKRLARVRIPAKTHCNHAFVLARVVVDDHHSMLDWVTQLLGSTSTG
jgi:hypothetical protein